MKQRTYPTWSYSAALWNGVLSVLSRHPRSPILFAAERILCGNTIFIVYNHYA